MEEWIVFLQIDEGQPFIAHGNLLPEEGREALYSIIKGGKGKAKGKGWNLKGKGGKGDKGDKGKGKGETGKGKGACHTCGEFGHYARECPQRQAGASEQTWT